MTENVIVIGGGMAGLSASVYLSRANLNPLVFAGSPPGGQIALTSEVENFPGYSSILGPELVFKLREQALKFNSRIIDENVISVDFSKKPFVVKTTKDEYFANTVLIATGAKALWLGLDSEQKLRGKGVSACATCDGFFFRDKTVAVIGGGDTACEEALTLTKFAKKVYLIHRRDQLRASKIMQDRVKENKKIEIIWNAVVDEIIGENKVEGIKLKIQNPKSEILNSKQIENSNDKNSKQFKNQDLEFKVLDVEGVFVAIGHKPDTDLFKGQIELDEKGYVITTDRLAIELMKSKIQNPKSEILNSKQIENSNDKNSKHSENLKIDYWQLFNNLKFNINYRSATSVAGVFAAGDCVDYIYRQASTAAGMGVAAALEVERYLKEK